jgi:hypothetical protein
MDPWLESHWGSAHLRLISELQSQIAAQLPQDLYAEVEETVYVFDQDDQEQPVKRLYRPDVAVFHQPAETGGQPGTAVMEPESEFVRIVFPDEPIVEGFIEIRQLSEGNPLVTALEVLSPTNKSTTAGKRAYLAKRKAYRQSEANVVEIDLLRAGDPLLEAPLENLIRNHPRLAWPYRCNIRRPREPEPAVDIRPISLRTRLPRIQVPLRANDPAVFIDLQQPIDLVYQLGSYARRIDYSKPPVPSLSPADAEWAATLVRQES